MKEDILFELIHKKSTGQLTKEEVQLLDSLLENKETQVVAEKIESDWDTSKLYLEDFQPNVTSSLAQLKAKIQQEETVIPKIVSIQKRRRSWLRVAAAIAILAVGSWFSWNAFNSNTDWQHVAVTDTIKNMNLEDGSKVAINTNSRFSYPDQFENNLRLVKLKGEAFFDIAKNASKPFMIESDEVQIKVLGTSFNVKQRATAFEVALLEGVVALSIPKYPKIKMNPGELVRVDGTNFYDRSTADVDAFSAWRFQRMVFKESTIAKVIQRLQDEFDWTVNVADQALLKRKITATIPKNDPELLLEALSEIYDLQIEQLDNKAYLIK